jgi:hypothetical protein
MPADVRGVARGPGAFEQRTAGMAVARLRDAALSASLARRVCGRRSAQGVQQLSRGLETGEVAACGHGGHRDSALHPAEGLKRLDDRGESPGLRLVCQCLFQTGQPFRVFGDRSEVCVAHELLRRAWDRRPH